MKNTNTFIKMLGLFISIFVYILSCLGAYISPEYNNLLKSTIVNRSMPKNDLHVQHESIFSVTPMLFYNTTSFISKNQSNHKMTFQDEITSSNHAERKRLIAEPSVSTSQVFEIYINTLALVFRASNRSLENFFNILSHFSLTNCNLIQQLRNQLAIFHIPPLQQSFIVTYLAWSGTN